MLFIKIKKKQWLLIYYTPVIFQIELITKKSVLATVQTNSIASPFNVEDKLHHTQVVVV